MGLRPAVCGALFPGRQHVARRDDAQRVDAPAVGAQYAELEAIDAERLAAAWQPAELLHDEAGHGVEALLLGKLRSEELVDAGHAAHRELPLRLAADVLVVLDVELIVDLAHDLLDDVLDGAQA